MLAEVPTQVFRGIATTDDPENPTLVTAPTFGTRREAVRAVQRAAKYAGYDVTREQCHAELSTVGTDDDQDDDDDPD